MISLFFTRDSFGNGFFDLADLQEIGTFFDIANEGFQLMSDTENVEELMLGFPRQDKLGRFINLLRLLKILIRAERKVLTNFVYPKKTGNRDGQAITARFRFCHQ